jgi:hypothetical protein
MRSIVRHTYDTATVYLILLLYYGHVLYGIIPVKRCTAVQYPVRRPLFNSREPHRGGREHGCCVDQQPGFNFECWGCCRTDNTWYKQLLENLPLLLPAQNSARDFLRVSMEDGGTCGVRDAKNGLETPGTRITGCLLEKRKWARSQIRIHEK